MGLLITTSPKLYALLGVLGGMYLIYMGFKMITGGKRAIVIKDNIVSDQVKRSQLFKEAFWVAMSNPKALVFLMALFPQFVDENNALLPQFYVL
jgi:threonine/homoserine/homoserine lactone efflux protein